MQLTVSEEDDLPVFDIGMTSAGITQDESNKDEYDSDDSIVVIPDEETTAPNLFVNLASLKKDKPDSPIPRSKPSSPTRSSTPPTTSGSVANKFTSYPKVSEGLASAISQAVKKLGTSSTRSSANSSPTLPTSKQLECSLISTIQEPSSTAEVMIPVTSIVTASSSSLVPVNNPEVMVNTQINDNQIVLARKINLLDLRTDDIKNIHDETTRTWMEYTIFALEKLKFVAMEVDKKVDFDLKMYIEKEIPPNLQYFDPLDCKDLIKALSSNLLTNCLNDLGERKAALDSCASTGKKSERYNYLIPHKAALLRNSLLAVAVTKRKIDNSSSATLWKDSKLSRKEKRRRFASPDQFDERKKIKNDNSHESSDDCHNNEVLKDHRKKDTSLTHKSYRPLNLESSSNCSELQAPTAQDIQIKFQNMRKCFQSIDSRYIGTIFTSHSTLASNKPACSNHCAIQPVPSSKTQLDKLCLSKQPCQLGTSSIGLSNKTPERVSKVGNSSVIQKSSSRKIDAKKVADQSIKTVRPPKHTSLHNLGISSEELPLEYNYPFNKRRFLSNVLSAYLPQLVWNGKDAKSTKKEAFPCPKSGNEDDNSATEKEILQFSESHKDVIKKSVDKTPLSTSQGARKLLRRPNHKNETDVCLPSPEIVDVTSSIELVSSIGTGETGNSISACSNFSNLSSASSSLRGEASFSMTKAFIKERLKGQQKQTKLIKKLLHKTIINRQTFTEPPAKDWATSDNPQTPSYLLSAKTKLKQSPANKPSKSDKSLLFGDSDFLRLPKTVLCKSTSLATSDKQTASGISVRTTTSEINPSASIKLSIRMPVSDDSASVTKTQEYSAYQKIPSIRLPNLCKSSPKISAPCKRKPGMPKNDVVKAGLPTADNSVLPSKDPVSSKNLQKSDQIKSSIVDMDKPLQKKVTNPVDPPTVIQSKISIKNAINPVQDKSSALIDKATPSQPIPCQPIFSKSTLFGPTSSDPDPSKTTPSGPALSKPTPLKTTFLTPSTSNPTAPTATTLPTLQTSSELKNASKAATKPSNIVEVLTAANKLADVPVPEQNPALRCGSPGVIEVTPSTIPKRKQKPIEPGIIYIKPEPGTNQVPIPVRIPDPTTPMKKCGRTNCKNYTLVGKELCPLHQQKQQIREIAQLMSGSRNKAPVRTCTSSNVPAQTVTTQSFPTTAVPPSSTSTQQQASLELSTARTPVPQLPSCGNPTPAAPALQSIVSSPDLEQSPTRVAPNCLRHIAPGSAMPESAVPGSDVPPQFLSAPAQNLPAGSPGAVLITCGSPTDTKTVTTNSPSDLDDYINAGVMLDQTIAMCYPPTIPLLHQFQSVGDFSFQRSNTLASLDKRDLERIKACKKTVSNNFTLSDMFVAKEGALESEVHLYITAVCISEKIQSLKGKLELPGKELLQKIAAHVRSPFKNQKLSIYTLLNLLFNIVYTAEFSALPPILSSIDFVTDKGKHDYIRVMALIEECFNLLQNDQLVACRFFIASSFRSIIVFENVLDKRLPHLLIDDVCDIIMKLEEQDFILKQKPHSLKFPELLALQKYGVTGEFFMLRRYVALQSVEKLTREFVKSVVIHKIAQRGSGGSTSLGMVLCNTSKSSHPSRHPTPPGLQHQPHSSTTPRHHTPPNLQHKAPSTATTRHPTPPNLQHQAPTSSSKCRRSPNIFLQQPPVFSQANGPPNRTALSQQHLIPIAQRHPMPTQRIPIPGFPTNHIQASAMLEKYAGIQKQLATQMQQLQEQMQVIGGPSQQTQLLNTQFLQLRQTSIQNSQVMSSLRQAFTVPTQQNQLHQPVPPPSVQYNPAVTQGQQAQASLGQQAQASQGQQAQASQGQHVNHLLLNPHRLHAIQQLFKGTPAQQPNQNSAPQQPNQHSAPQQLNQHSAPQQPNQHSAPQQPNQHSAPQQPNQHSAPQQPNHQPPPSYNNQTNQTMTLTHQPPPAVCAQTQPPSYPQTQSCPQRQPNANCQQQAPGYYPQGIRQVLVAVNNQNMQQQHQQHMVAGGRGLQPMNVAQLPPNQALQTSTAPTEVEGKRPKRKRSKNESTFKKRSESASPAKTGISQKALANQTNVDKPLSAHTAPSNTVQIDPLATNAPDHPNEKKAYRVQEVGKPERYEMMTQAEADVLQERLLEEYNKKKAEEAAYKKTSSSSSDVTIVEKKKPAPVIIEIDSEDDVLADTDTTSNTTDTASASSHINALSNPKEGLTSLVSPTSSQKKDVSAPSTSSSAASTDNQLTLHLTSDNHVTSTTRSPGNDMASKEQEEILVAELLSLQHKPLSDIIDMVHELCKLETSNDTAVRDASELKRKAEEEYIRVSTKADHIKRRRQELLNLCTEKQAEPEPDLELSIIDHTAVTTPSTESLRINRGRLGQLSDTVKNMAVCKK